MNIDFSELGNMYFDISDIFVVQQLVGGKSNFTMHNPRSTDGLLLFANTMGVCYQKGLPPLYIPHGALVYLPHNSTYVWENTPPVGSDIQENLLFEFTLNSAETLRSKDEKRALSHAAPSKERISFGEHVFIVSTRHSALYEKLFRSLIEAFHAPDFNPLSVYSIAYELFNTLSINCCIERKNTVDTSIIKAGLKYLVECSSDVKSIKEIADICNISVSYFERVFHSYAGVSPGQYRTLHRINYIKMYLQNKNMSLEEISEKMGYYDSGYLCRIFKKKTGMTPREYRQIYFAQTQSLK